LPTSVWISTYARTDIRTLLLGSPED
jgi:hypothetical protein